MHEDVMKLVPTFKTTISKFAEDPVQLEAFVAYVSAYMHVDTSLWHITRSPSSGQPLALRGRKIPPA